MRNRCLVLGASGFLGVHLTEALVHADVQVRAFSRTRPLTSVPDLEWFQGDFHSSADLRRALVDCDTVYHLISSTTPASSNESPWRDAQQNVLGTLQLLELMRATETRKIIFVSTGGAIYGPSARIPSDEDQPTEPITAYGIGKFAVEKYLALYHRLAGLSYCVLRVANPFGERQPPDRAQGAIGVFLEKALHGLPVDIWGDGEVVRDFIYVHDVIRALLSVRTYEGPHRLFNIGSGRGWSLNEVLSALEAELNRPVSRRYLSSRAADVPVSLLDVSRAKDVLGWRPQVCFQDGLRHTVAWMRDQTSKSVLRAG